MVVCFAFVLFCVGGYLGVGFFFGGGVVFCFRVWVCFMFVWLGLFWVVRFCFCFVLFFGLFFFFWGGGGVLCFVSFCFLLLVFVFSLFLFFFLSFFLSFFLPFLLPLLLFLPLPLHFSSFSSSSFSFSLVPSVLLHVPTTLRVGPAWTAVDAATLERSCCCHTGCLPRLTVYTDTGPACPRTDP